MLRGVKIDMDLAVAQQRVGWSGRLLLCTSAGLRAGSELTLEVDQSVWPARYCVQDVIRKIIACVTSRREEWVLARLLPAPKAQIAHTTIKSYL